MRDGVEIASGALQGLVKVNPEVQLTKQKALASGSQGSVSPFVRLTASLFFRPGPPKVIALVSCTSQEGVSSVSQSFLDFLVAQLGTRATLLPAAECLERPSPTNFASGAASGIGLVPSEAFVAARQDSDVLLIDCSSLESSPAVFVLARHVDGILLVVEDGKHSMKDIQRAIELIKSTNGVILGVVLNKRRQIFPKWLVSLLTRIN